MSRPRFVADEDLRGPIIDAVLRLEPAMEIVLLTEVGRDVLPDEEQLDYAATEGLIRLSQDVNTMKGAAERRIRNGQPMAGLLFSSQHALTRVIAESILIIWGAAEAEEYQDCIDFLPLP